MTTEGFLYPSWDCNPKQVWTSLEEYHAVVQVIQQMNKHGVININEWNHVITFNSAPRKLKIRPRFDLHSGRIWSGALCSAHYSTDRQTDTGKRASGVRESDPGPGRGTRADRGNLRRSAASQSRLASLFHNLTSDCLWSPLRCRLAARPTGNSLYLCSLQARSAGTRLEKGWGTFPENFDREQSSVLAPVESRLVLVNTKTWSTY